MLATVLLTSPLLKPQIGLIFWMTLTFLVILFLLKKFAWSPILKMITDREQSIEKALESAESARKEMQTLRADNEKIIQEARTQRDTLLKEAREMKESIIAEAKSKAGKEAEKVLASARETINNEKIAAITELKNQVAVLSIQIAEKIIREHLSSDEKQKSLVKNLTDEITLN